MFLRAFVSVRLVGSPSEPTPVRSEPTSLEKYHCIPYRKLPVRVTSAMVASINTWRGVTSIFSSVLIIRS